MAFFPKASSYGCALFLDHRPLVGDGLRRAYIANELLDWASVRMVHTSTWIVWNLRDVILEEVA